MIEKKIKNIYKALVVRIKKKTVLVDAKLKCLYNVPIYDFSTDEIEKLYGTYINIYIKNLDPLINKNRIASYKRAKQESIWNNIINIFQSKELLYGQIASSTKGGYSIHLDNGFYAFLPASQIAEDEVDQYIPNSGQKFSFYIIGINRLHFNIIVSRKLVIMQNVANMNANSLNTINIGASLFGIIKGISNAGLFIYINETYSGFISAEEAAHGHNIDLFQEFSTGQKVEAIVTDIVENRINLSIKKNTANPMTQFIRGQKINVVVMKKIIDETNDTYHLIGHLLENSKIFCRILKEDKSITDKEIDEILNKKGSILVSIKSINEESYSLLCTTKKSYKEIWNNFVLYVQENNYIISANVINKSKYMLFLQCMEKELCVPITQVSCLDTMNKFNNINVGDSIDLSVVHIDKKSKEVIGSIRRLEYIRNNDLQHQVQELLNKKIVDAKLSYTIDNSYAIFNIGGIIEQSIHYNKVTSLMNNIKSNPEATIPMQIYASDEFGNLEIGPVSSDVSKINVKTKKFNIGSVLAQFRNTE